MIPYFSILCVNNLIIKFSNSGVIVIVEYVLIEKVNEVLVLLSLRLSHQELTNSQDASDQVQGSLSLTVLLLLKVVVVILVNMLHLFNKEV